ncbi:holocytochrome c synthase [Coemansia sp. RSA 353]|nr:holocytochrome c synthase [Coemansia sp. RSA 1591]KAJ2144742.1 holocytochrome c synthase [Coemansia sp. RSA 564]KAJ2172062.1 holocytochrome c synthase [Coemansia sp. RSA 560]KAJ2187393.1 holocytochrome c synthase [Coemansia sp. RSA 532]KAJ2275567.1 holocytochrome c synthase [Coemansia sp. RSA 451]KAJ2299728.1 holocytochrome c synthase [Coemansia sp. RSA 353]
MSDKTADTRATCPVDHSASGSQPAAPHGSGCPVDHTKKPGFLSSLTNTTASTNEAKCPVDHAESQVNPLNMMPALAQTMHEGQQTALSTDRESSTIPRADQSSDTHKWEYPSPQQFYNALARKNMPAPEEYVDVMVDIHNFLNEGAWNEVLKWESRHECKMPRLIRLQGRPRDISPLARIYDWRFGVRPFDRHDWFVDRCGKQVRYVIDYYEGEPKDDMPVFNLVVRPAIDDFSSLTDRAKQMWQDAKQKYFPDSKK